MSILLQVTTERSQVDELQRKKTKMCQDSRKFREFPNLRQTMQIFPFEIQELDS